MFGQERAPGCSMGAGAPSARDESSYHMKAFEALNKSVLVMPVQCATDYKDL